MQVASSLILHINLFIIMVDMQDQIHFLTHTRVDIPHRLLVATLIVSVICFWRRGRGDDQEVNLVYSGSCTLFPFVQWWGHGFRV
jgi:hypothetical protein